MRRTKARKFQIVGVIPGPVHFQGREIDLKDMDDHQLADLHKKGLPYVQPVVKDASDQK